MLASAARFAAAAVRRVAASAPRAPARCAAASACAPRAWHSGVDQSGFWRVDRPHPPWWLLPARARGVAPLPPPPPRRAHALLARAREALPAALAPPSRVLPGWPPLGRGLRGGHQLPAAARAFARRAGPTAAQRLRRARKAPPHAAERAAEPPVVAAAADSVVVVDTRDEAQPATPEPPPPRAPRLLVKVLAQQAVLNGLLFALLFSLDRLINSGYVYTWLAFVLLSVLAVDANDGWAELVGPEPLFAAPRQRPVEAPPGGGSGAFARARVHVECLLYAMASAPFDTWAGLASAVYIASAQAAGTEVLVSVQLLTSTLLLTALLTLREEMRALRRDMRAAAARGGGTGRL